MQLQNELGLLIDKYKKYLSKPLYKQLDKLTVADKPRREKLEEALEFVKGLKSSQTKSTKNQFEEQVIKPIKERNKLKAEKKKDKIEIRNKETAKTYENNKHSRFIHIYHYDIKIFYYDEFAELSFENRVYRQVVMKNRNPESIAIPKIWLNSKVKSDDDYSYEGKEIDYTSDIEPYEPNKEIFEHLSKIYDLKYFMMKFKKVDTITPRSRGTVKMGNKSLAYKFLEMTEKQSEEYIKQIEIKTEEKEKENRCVIDYILNKLSGKKYFIKFNEFEFKQQLKQLNINYSSGLSVDDIKKWVRTFYPNYVNVYPLDALYKMFEPYIVSSAKYSLCFISNNGHIYPIDDSDKIKAVANRGEYTLGSVIFKTVSNGYIYMENDNEKYNDLVSGKLSGNFNTVFYGSDLLKLISDIVLNTGYIVSHIDIKQSEVVAFQHPVNEMIIRKIKDYKEINEINTKLFEHFQVDAFKLDNVHTYSSVGKNIFKVVCGEIPMKSVGDVKTNKIIDTYHTHPLIHTLESIKKNNKCQGFDCNKSYSNALYCMSEDYPLFTLFDEFKPYDGILENGEYLVDAFDIEQLGGVKFDRQILSYNVVKYLIQNNYITSETIKYKRKAFHVLSKDILKKFVSKVYELFDDSISKKIVNSFIGSLGKRFAIRDKGCITNHLDTVHSLISDYYDTGSVNYTCLNGIYFFRLSEKLRIQKGDFSSLYRAILSQGMINLLELIKKSFGVGSRLIGYNTDSCFIENPVSFNIQSDLGVNNMPLYKLEDWKPKIMMPFELSEEFKDIYVNMTEWNVLDENDDNNDKSMVMVGGGGYGKSWDLKKNYNKETDLVMAFTHTACDNLRKDGVDICTLSAFFYRQDEIKNKRIKRIIIDEFSMVPRELLEKLYYNKVMNSELIIRMYGDPNQLKSVEKQDKNNSKFYDCFNYRQFRDLVGNNIIYKKYIEASARYDAELKEVLDYVLKYQTLPNKFKPINQALKTNISYTNEKRERVNKYFLKDGWYIGMKVVCKDNNYKNVGVFNNKQFFINDIVGDKISINDLNGNLMTVKDEVLYINKGHFEPAFCITTHKYQGMTISEEFNIYDVDLMSLNCIYTALSRAKKLSQIHLKYTDRVFPREVESRKVYTMEPKTFERSYIYKLTNDKNKVCYIGKTDRTIEERLTEHINENPLIKKFDGQWKAERLEQVLYTSKKTVLKREATHISEYKGEYKLINVQHNKPEKVVKPKKNIIQMGSVHIKDTEAIKIYEISDGTFRIKYKGKCLKKMRFNAENKEQKRKEIEEARKNIISDYL